MISVAQKIAKNTFFNFINKIIGFLCALILSVIAARFLGPVVLGKYALVVSVITIIGFISNLGLAGVTTKYVSEYSSVENYSIRNTVINYVLKIKIITSLVATIIVILSAKFFANFYNDNRLVIYIYITSLYLLPAGLADIFGCIFSGMQEYKYIAMRTSILYPINAIAMFIILKLGFGIMGFIWVNVVYSFIECVFYFLLLKKRQKLTFSFRLSLPANIKKKVFSYNWQVALIVLLNYVVWQRSEVFFLGKFHPASETGFYSLAYGIIEKVQVFLPTIFSGVLMPAISELYGKKQLESIRNVYIHSTRYLLFLAIPITLGIICCSKQLTLMLYGNAYLPMVSVLNILLISGCFVIISGAGSSVLYATENQHFLLKWGILMTILNITLDLALIPRFAAIGAAMANTITQIVAVSGWIIKACSVLSVRFPVKDLSKTIFASLSMAIVSVMIINLSKFPPLTFVAIVIGIGSYLAVISLTKFFTLADFNLFGSFKHRIPNFICRVLECLIFPSIKVSLKQKINGINE